MRLPRIGVCRRSSCVVSVQPRAAGVGRDPAPAARSGDWRLLGGHARGFVRARQQAVLDVLDRRRSRAGRRSACGPSRQRQVARCSSPRAARPGSCIIACATVISGTSGKVAMPDELAPDRRRKAPPASRAPGATPARRRQLKRLQHRGVLEGLGDRLDHVGAGRDIGASTRSSRLGLGRRVGAGDDDQVGVAAGFDRGADLGHALVRSAAPRPRWRSPGSASASPDPQGSRAATPACSNSRTVRMTLTALP